MPSTYAHRHFGADVLQQLPAALQDQIGKNRALFDVGPVSYTPLTLPTTSRV